MKEQQAKEIVLWKKLLDKNKEAFIVAIELYNKPTIKYRVEGFSFFVCNAWELMLKAYLVKNHGNSSIYFSDKPNRTISLEGCIRKVFTNNKDPLRVNLERIVDLRNTSTHFITEEYEQIYIPLFQACVINYSNKLLDFFHEDITENLNANFLTLSLKLSTISKEEIQARYPKEIANKLLQSFEKIQHSVDDITNPNYAIPIHHDWYLTKKANEATLKFTFTKNAEKAATIIKEPRDMHKLYPYSTKECIKQINQFIQRESLSFINPAVSACNNQFNAFHFRLFLNFYDIKSNPDYCYKYTPNKLPMFSYNQKLIDFICDLIKKDPEHIIQSLRENIAKK